jgi:hypothetical protein
VLDLLLFSHFATVRKHKKRENKIEQNKTRETVLKRKESKRKK